MQSTMELSELKTYLQSKLAVTEELPFGPEALVYKVCGKMFALIAWQETPLKITLKTDPAQADLQRAMFSSIKPGYHMNKRHWNTIDCIGELTNAQLFGFIDDSYQLVVANLTKKERQTLQDLHTEN
jgi:predicted DNA-binding protein (MmcQ/YjbR family)